MTTINSSLPASDFHCGWQEIISGAVVTVVQYKQMVVFGPFILDGTLNIEGQLILEA